MSGRLSRTADQTHGGGELREPSPDFIACRWCGRHQITRRPLKCCRFCGRYQIGGARYNYIPKRQRIAQHAEAMREDPQAQRRLKIAQALRGRETLRNSFLNPILVRKGSPL
jgi:hypothetical protein